MFSPKIEIGAILTNDEIRDGFGVGNMGGMRRSRQNNCLVLISDHTKEKYEDKWHDGILHYTGMGLEGDQSITYSQNRTLYESRTNGVDVFLFEVIEPKRYIYRGPVQLCGEPYQEIQRDQAGNQRNVWMFPIKPLAGEPVVPEEQLDSMLEEKRKKALRMPINALKELAELNSSENPGTRTVSSSTVVRDPYVSEYVKRISGGKCALCHCSAPFIDKSGKPYLETHHIIWLSHGGSDSIANVVALCPNCHRKMHIIDDARDVDALKQFVSGRG